MSYDLCGKEFDSVESLESFIKNKPFESWWDKDKFISTLQIRFSLYKYCNTYFPIWYDKRYTIWDRESDFLCIFASDHFDIWWDKDKFDYDKGLFFLSKNCSDHFDKWINTKIKIVKKSTRIGVAKTKLNFHNNSVNKFIKWFNKIKSNKKLQKKIGVNNVS